MLGSYAFILRRRLWTIVVIVVLLAPLAFLALTSRSPVYRSEAVIEVGTGTVAEQILGQSRPFEEPVRRVATQAEIVTSRPVAERAVMRLRTAGLTVSFDDALGRIEAVPSRSSNYIRVFGTGASALEAHALANAFVSAYFDQRRVAQRSELRRLESELEQSRQAAEQELAELAADPAGVSAREEEAALSRINNVSSLLETVRLRMSVETTGVSLLAEPSTPTSPANDVDPVLAAIASLLGAGLIAGALAMALELTRDAVRTRQEAERLTYAPVFAVLARPAPDTELDQLSVDAGRSIRLGLMARNVGVQPRTVLVAGLRDDAEDSALVATVLAVASARGGQRVLLVSDTPPATTSSGSVGSDEPTRAPAGSRSESEGVQVHELPEPGLSWCRITADGTRRGLLDVARPVELLAELGSRFDLVVLTAGTAAVRAVDLAQLAEATVAVCALGRTPARPLVTFLETMEHDRRTVDGLALVAYQRGARPGRARHRPARPRRVRPTPADDAALRRAAAGPATGGGGQPRTAESDRPQGEAPAGASQVAAAQGSAEESQPERVAGSTPDADAPAPVTRGAVVLWSGGDAAVGPTVVRPTAWSGPRQPLPGRDGGDARSATALDGGAPAVWDEGDPAARRS